MKRALHRAAGIVAFLAAALLAACGGGSEPAASAAAAPTQQVTTAEVGAPQATGDTATDGFNRFNYRRQQAGLASISRNALIDSAAQGHSNYQKLNDTITHDQTPGSPGFTGKTVLDRLTAAGFTFNQNSFAYGEVISATGDPSGINAADELVGAIYHRNVILEPMFKEAGAGAATVPNGYTYLTVDFAANGLGSGVGSGNLVTYPVANQQGVERFVFSDREVPDPVPGQDQVGYPVSIHADITAAVKVQSFTLRPRGGAALEARLLTNAGDSNTPQSAAAIVPLAALASQTTYDAQFIGSVDGVAVSRSWSFTTR
jgi:uncharacterized protein YkwD